MPAYYLHIDSQVQGPYSEAEVKGRFESGMLQPDTQVCDDSGEWRRFADMFPFLFTPPSRPSPDSRSGPVLAPPPINPYRPPEAPIIVSREQPSPMQSYHGIGRLGFLGSFIGLYVLGRVLSALTMEKNIYMALLEGIFPSILGMDFLGELVAAFMKKLDIIKVLTAGLMLIPVSSRLKNIGRNPGWCFLFLVPLVGLFITAPCFLLPAGYQDHRKLDLPAKIIGGCFLALLIAILIYVWVIFLQK